MNFQKRGDKRLEQHQGRNLFAADGDKKQHKSSCLGFGNWPSQQLLQTVSWKITILILPRFAVCILFGLVPSFVYL